MGLDWFADVLEFHRKLAPDRIGTTPAWPDADTLRLTNRLIWEEWDEMWADYGSRDLPGTVDGVLDLVYVLLGKLVSMGVDPRDVWDEIQRANLSKVGAGKDASGKVRKPPGWLPPDVAGILAAQGPLEGGG